MTLHTSRDFLSTGFSLSTPSTYLAPYFTAMFLITVLNYVLVGQTNFNITGGTYTLTSGNTGALNQGSNDPYAFSPGNAYVVSAADIGRILVCKSPGNPMINSGLFRVTGVNTTNNWWYINYRSGAVPPAETGMQFALYENELVFYGNINQTGNGITGTYTGVGSATQSRIILQSPSSLNWQLRICYENTYDCLNGGVTMAPGYGGNGAGDFAPGGQVLHGLLFFNGHAGSGGSGYWLYGTCCGFEADNSYQNRFFFWGDDSAGTFFGAARNVVPASTACDTFVHFGLPEDEEQPLPPKNIQRLFVMGRNVPGPGSDGIYWACDSNVGRGGMAYGLSNTPISCIYSLQNPLFGSVFGGTSGANPLRNSPNAGDCQYIATTELLPVDLLVGTMDYMNDYGFNNEFLILEGRRLGRAPFVRMGRSNYGYFQTSTDPNNSWLHLSDGIYLPWQGPILP